VARDRNAGTIRAGPREHCALCGSPGQRHYTGLRDHLYGAPGEWNLARCTNPRCALLWLDPMPLAGAIGAAYEGYYTRTGRAAVPARRHTNAWFLYLRRRPPGRLLEIGCGDGSRLAAFRDRGWEVTGQEIDAEAATAAARRRNLEVLAGPLEALNLPAAHYDAIAMNHVLEHVHDPAALLCECRRLLAPGGVLSAVTPNAASLGHRVFAANWRGLEPPRHLYIYTPAALRALACAAGFEDCTVSTSAANAAGTITQDSLRQWYRAHGPGGELPGIARRLLAHVFRLLEVIWLRVDRRAGEECVLLANAGGIRG